MKLYATLFVILGSSLIADAASSPPPFAQGDVPPHDYYLYAYNAPAQVELKNEDGSNRLDLFLDASFLYYHADEEGLDLGTSAALVPEKGTFFTVATNNSITAFQSFDYRPGFQVGAGGRFDEWTLGGKYTWIRQTVHTSHDAPNPHIAHGKGVWVTNNWFEQVSPVTGQTICGDHLHSKWRLVMNLGDLMVSRPCYQGRHFIISPEFGLRAAWISQKVSVDMKVPDEILSHGSKEWIHSKNSSKSWGLGPRAVLGSNFLLGYGLRLEGDVGASILFTKYTHVKHKENVAEHGSIPSSLSSTYGSYSCLRPVAEASLGTGWGDLFVGTKGSH